MFQIEGNVQAPTCLKRNKNDREIGEKAQDCAESSRGEMGNVQIEKLRHPIDQTVQRWAHNR